MLLTEEELVKEYDSPEIQRETNPEFQYTTLETLGAAMRQENVVSSFFAGLPYSEYFSSQKIDNDFDVVQATTERNLDNYLVNFADVFNQEEFELRAQKIENELRDREILASAGWGGVAAQIIGGASDPINLIPIGGAAAKGVKAKNWLQATIRTARIAAPSIAIQESALNATQETRTLGESVINISVGAVLSGALGGAVHAIANHGMSFDGLAKRVEEDIFKPENTKVIEAEKNLYNAFNLDESVGAAKVYETTLQQESVAPSLGTFKVTKGLTPVARLADSPVKGVRQFSQKLITNPMFFNKNFEEIATPQAVEDLRFEQDIRSATVRKSFIEQFKEHKINARKTGQKHLNKKAFSEAVSYAMRNGDVGADDSITKIAQKIREEVIDPLKDRAIKQGLLPEDVAVETADSYFTRLVSKNKVLADVDGFRKVVYQDLLEKAGTIKRSKAVEFEGKIKRLKGKINKASGKKLEELEQQLIDIEVDKRLALEIFEDDALLDDYLNDIVNDIYSRVTGVGRTPFAHEVSIAEHGPLKGRTWDIMDNKIQDYLENDAEMVLELYNRSMTGQLLLQEQFGTINFEKAVKEVDNSFNETLEAAAPKDKDKITNQYNKNKRDMKLLWDLTNGTYRSAKDFDNMFIRGLQDIRAINYMRLLGSVTISSMADVGNIVAANGIKNVFGDLLIPTIANLKKIKPAIEELRSAGLVYESLLNSRVQALAEIGDPTARGTYFSRFTNNASRVFTQATMITEWNDTMKTASGILTQSKILKASNQLASGKKLDKNLAAELNLMGLNKSQLRAISKEFSKHGNDERGILLSGVNKWDDQGLARSYRAALYKSVNLTIVTKGIGDIPAFMNTQLGKSFGQFQNFSFAANQRITVRHAQRMAKGDLNVMQGIVSTVAIGMLVAYLKSEHHKQSVERAGGDTKGLGTDDWTTDKWILEGVDRSGLVPIMMMFNNPWEKVGMPGLSKGLSFATGNELEPVSRYAARSEYQSLFGPTFGTVADSVDVVAAIRASQQTGKPLSDNDIHRLRTLVPMQNLIGVRRMFDHAERIVKENVGQ